MIKTPDQIGVSPKHFESLFDILEMQIQIGGAGAGHTWDSPPNHYEGVAMTRVSKQPGNSRKSIAIEYLHLTREQLERSKNLRKHYANLARENGLTNQEIGDILGISEARVRQIVRAA